MEVCAPYEPEPGEVKEELQKSGGGISGNIYWTTYEQEIPHRDPIYHHDGPINLPGTIRQHWENGATQRPDRGIQRAGRVCSR